MGLFSKIIHQVTQPVTRILGPTATAVLLPAIPISQIAAKGIDSLSSGLVSAAAPSRSNTSVGTVPGGSYLLQPPNITYGAPQYGAPSYGGGGGGSYDAFSYQPSFNPYGGQSWDSSTRYSPPLTTQYQVSSAQPRDRSWEDLALQIIPFFL